MDLLTLIVLLPLAGFLLNGLVGPRAGKGFVSVVGCGLPILAFLASLRAVSSLDGGDAALMQTAYTWANVGGFPFEISFWLDRLSAVMILIVTGVGSMAIVKGARNLDAAKKFYDWALTPEAQKIGLEVKEFAIPTNRNVPLPAQVPKLTDIKVINYDFAKYGASDTRKRLLERWEKDVNNAPR